MINTFFSKGRKFFLSQQETILGAAQVIILMSIASYVLGFIRERIILSYFTPSEVGLYFASFRLPDLLFQILIFATYTSAFIPVFTKLLKRDNGNTLLWQETSKIINVALTFFIPIAILVGLLTRQFYQIFTPSLSALEISKIVEVSRILLLAQVIFAASYILSAALESSRRFFVPALAPIFYNLGIIFGTIFLSGRFGLLAPAMAVVIGAVLHLLIQLPLAIKLGFKFNLSLRLDGEVSKIAKLATPRFVDLSYEQFQSTIELFLASFISSASYTYFVLGVTLRTLPVSLFGGSLAKAAFPTLSQDKDDPQKFKTTLLQTLYQIVYLVIPIASFFIVLRTPVSRLLFGTKNFDWEATVQTGLVISSFAVAVVVQSVVLLLERAFYALHDTKTPVSVSLITTSLIIFSDFILVQNLHLPVWAMATSFSIGVTIQAFILLTLLQARIGTFITKTTIMPIIKMIIAATFESLIMYALVKSLDQSIIDTSYTLNLFVLTSLVAGIGLGVYALLSSLLKIEEFFIVLKIITSKVKIFSFQKPPSEPITPPTNDNLS